MLNTATHAMALRRPRRALRSRAAHIGMMMVAATIEMSIAFCMTFFSLQESNETARELRSESGPPSGSRQ